ncbi:MAG: hypothetical protein JWM16_5046 [Verrucomicrobiales bacterium]|nr:hypothetical protein [Verrucomicrobiales bacterium]
MIKTLYVLLALAWIACGCANVQTSSNSSLERNVATNSFALKTIADHHATSESVSRVLNELGPVQESSEFWASIANDDTYPTERRRRCIIELFRRHVHAGMNLREVAEKLHKPDWLPDKDIVLVELVSGHIPVKTVFGDTVVALLLLPQGQGDKEAVYLRISGKIRPQAVGEVLRGESTTGSVAQSKVEEIGFAVR